MIFDWLGLSLAKLEVEIIKDIEKSEYEWVWYTSCLHNFSNLNCVLSLTSVSFSSLQRKFSGWFKCTHLFLWLIYNNLPEIEIFGRDGISSPWPVDAFISPCLIYDLSAWFLYTYQLSRISPIITVVSLHSVTIPFQFLYTLVGGYPPPSIGKRPIYFRFFLLKASLIGIFQYIFFFWNLPSGICYF